MKLAGKYPFCSVVVLNYYGEKVLELTLNSLLKLDYPKNRYEIIVVDNNSSDLSPQIINKYANDHKIIKPVWLDKNYGFSKGNNFGIKQSKGEYVALLNNDCVVDKNWLKELVSTAIKDHRIFAVNSKILLYPKYLKFTLKIDPEVTPLYSWLSKSNLCKFNTKKMYLNLIGKDGLFKIEAPFDMVKDSEIEIEVACSLKENNRVKDLKKLINFPLPGAKIIKIKRKNMELSYKISIDLRNKALKQAEFNRIQNAGTMPFQDGYARDIGTIIRYSTPYYEHDNGQYNMETEIYAFCGAAVLLNKNILDKIGYLDESFFMYYEDIEISERARLNGYKIYYSPKAVVRHIHALSSKEGSAFFIYNVEKGRMLHVFYNFPAEVFWQEYLKLIIIIMYGMAGMIINIGNLRAISKDKSIHKAGYSRKLQLFKVLLFFFFNYFYILFLKKFLKQRNDKAIENNYAQILSGRWYFN